MDLIRSIIGGAGNVLDSVKRLIASVVGVVWDHVHAAFEVIWASIHRGFDFATAIWNNVLGLAQQLYATADNIVNGVIRQLREWASAAIGAVRATVDGLAGFVNGAVDSLNRGIRGVFDGAIGWVLDHVWRPLTGAVDELRNAVGDVIGWFRRYGAAVAHFVDKWLGRIVRWLEDPVGETMRWVDGFATAAPRVVLGWVTNAMAKEGDKVAELLERTLRF